MDVHLDLRNDSAWKRLYRRDVLQALARHICEGEGVKHDVELSVLLCDDPFIQALNQRYRQEDCPTDVLSFGQTGPVAKGLMVLGDIVISLETVARNCRDDRRAMRAEVRLLFCHGLLHLLGHKHDDAAQRARMIAKQAHYLHITTQAAWRTDPKAQA